MKSTIAVSDEAFDWMPRASEVEAHFYLLANLRQASAQGMKVEFNARSGFQRIPSFDGHYLILAL